MAQLFPTVVLIALALSSCGKSDTPGQGVTTLLGSQWEGTFTPQDLKSGSVQKVKMSLSSDKSFSVDVIGPSLISAIRGSFIEYPRNKVMVMSVQNSGMQLLGSSGQSYEYSYDLSDNELKMNGVNGRYLLLREGATSDNGSAARPYEGDWSCAGDRNVININIDQNRFRGRRSEAGRTTVYFEGKVIPALVESRASLLARAGLEVESASLPTFAGQKLQLNVIETSKAVLFAISEEMTEVPNTAINCKRGS